MPSKEFLHRLSGFKVLVEMIVDQRTIEPQLVEKDYWLMHCLWGLKNQNMHFDLKGGTSLSKGWGIINRFSEDVDIQIVPPDGMDVKSGKNHDKPAHIESRSRFFQWVADTLSIPGISVARDHEFDDAEKRNAGIRLNYESVFPSMAGLKPYVLLEVGFDTTTPNTPMDISSWVYDHASSLQSNFMDNRALAITCYNPEYTLIEKLDAILRKFRQQQQNTTMPVNFLRHYYDVYELLGQERVIKFIGTPEYLAHKQKRFRPQTEKDLTKNEAFIMGDPKTRRLYTDAYERGAALYYAGQPSFEKILARIGEFASLM